MRFHLPELAALAAIAPLACASLDVERRDYILAHPHGWIELTLDDGAIPNVPRSEDEPDALTRPDSCSVEVRIDGEPFVYGSAYPIGDAPPYSVATGFRFPVPLGSVQLRVVYAGCRLEADKLVPVRTDTSVAVEEDRVSEVLFDGAALAVKAPRDDTTVTLEDVYDAVIGAERR